ncbi:hypothetical protein ACFQJC_06265 [Haloferax namakaokahaiae]|uniref:Uncharacterized protein n=1 Tax=Haloferax namakaokahaiae TaxID=1748331 RepID=A0ABD5ZDF3_9EURY
MGHVGFGLSFALPAWCLWDDKGSAAFVDIAALAALFPDGNLFLAHYFLAQFPHPQTTV